VDTGHWTLGLNSEYLMHQRLKTCLFLLSCNISYRYRVEIDTVLSKHLEKKQFGIDSSLIFCNFRVFMRTPSKQISATPTCGVKCVYAVNLGLSVYAY